MLRRILVLAGATVFFAGCGGDPEPKEYCGKLIDAFAAAWDRCKVEPYEQAKQTWGRNITDQTCNPNTIDEGQFNKCTSEFGAADCTFVKSGGIPASCKDVLAH